MKIAERWFVMAGVALLGAIALAGLIVAIYAAWLFHDLPDASELADYRPATIPSQSIPAISCFPPVAWFTSLKSAMPAGLSGTAK